MIRRLIVVTFLICFTGTFDLFSQCVDSSLIQTTSCSPDWIPVCACDGKTYRNDCFARSNGFSPSNFSYGICDPIDFDFNPNPATGLIYVDAIVKNPGDMYVQLMDRFGRIFYSNVFPGVTEYLFQIDVTGFPTGLYFLNLWCNEGNKVRKVVVSDL